MDKSELERRTREFAKRVFKLVDKLPVTQGTKVINYQLLKSASSVAANYRAVNKAKSNDDFINKLKIVLEESDESNFWLSFMVDVGIIRENDPELVFLLKESNEFTAIFTSSIKTSVMKKMRRKF